MRISIKEGEFPSWLAGSWRDKARDSMAEMTITRQMGVPTELVLEMRVFTTNEEMELQLISANSGGIEFGTLVTSNGHTALHALQWNWHDREIHHRISTFDTWTRFDAALEG